MTVSVPSFAASDRFYAVAGVAENAVVLTESDMGRRRGGFVLSPALAALLSALPEQSTVSATINGGGTVTSSGDGPQTFSFGSGTTDIDLSAGSTAAPATFPSFTRVISTTRTRTRSTTFTISR